MSNSHTNYYQPNLQILYCSLEQIESWHHTNMSAPYWRVYHNKEGESHITIHNERGEKKIELTRDKIVVIPPNTDFSAAHQNSFYHFYLHFIARPPFYSIKNDFLIFRFDGPLQIFLSDLESALEKQGSTDVELSLLAHQLAIAVLLRIPADNLESSVSDFRILRVIELIKENIEKPLSNESLAAVIGMNVNAFSRLFRIQTGDSPHDYYLRVRIEHACLLLQFSNRNIEEIAGLCGFADRFHFSKAFKRFRNISPAVYRNKII